jgi:hypothetical protein
MIHGRGVTGRLRLWRARETPFDWHLYINVTLVYKCPSIEGAGELIGHAQV